jgi:two-component system, LytTR family, sensor kinase
VPAVTPKAIRIWPDLGLVTVFWAYVSLSNVLYGLSMQASLAGNTISHLFAPWNVRLIQHVVLYPALLAFLWISRRVGWQPLWRVPLQLLCGLGFAALATPAMDLAELLIGLAPAATVGASATPMAHNPPLQQGFLWLAGVTSFLLNYAFCLALLTGFEFYRRYRDAQLRAAALERSLAAAHLAALRMQLSPHTLFNLLHTIHGNIGWDPAVAQSMIVQLGDLLRRLLRSGERDVSRLQDELEFARLYLQLQQRRFADRLTVSAPEHDAAPPLWVPSLILQPLVENAVVHGLAHHHAAVSVRVEFALSDQRLLLRVVNSMAAGPAVVSSERTGIGLRNVRERLAIQFGEQARLRSGPGGDCEWIAEIELPLLRADAAAGAASPTVAPPSEALA